MSWSSDVGKLHIGGEREIESALPQHGDRHVDLAVVEALEHGFRATHVLQSYQPLLGDLLSLRTKEVLQVALDHLQTDAIVPAPLRYPLLELLWADLPCLLRNVLRDLKLRWTATC